MRAIVAGAVVVSLACGLAACGDDDDGPTGPGQQTGVQVAASASNVFSPSTVDVTVGQSVTWVFGPVDHNVIFNPVTGAPQDIQITRNGSVVRTFSTVGTFPYVCTLHPGMSGSVRVLQQPAGVSIY